jgi:hypothetical protein
VKLQWVRTEIGGKTAPYDFAASDADAPVGRVYKHDGTQHSAGGWFWTMGAFGRGIDRSGINCSGIVETKAEAVRLLEDAYRRCRT